MVYELTNNFMTLLLQYFYTFQFNIECFVIMSSACNINVRGLAIHQIKLFQQASYERTYVKQKILYFYYIYSNRIKPDFISKQSQLELSQSGIGFVRGWNLAKS